VSLFQLLVLASLQVAGASVPAPAQSGMNCVLDRLAPQERRELGDALLANEPMSDKDEALLDRINGDCTGQLGLTDPEKGDALLGVLSSLIVERSGAALANVGVPPEVIDAWFDEQSVDLRSDLERPVSDAETDARIDSLLATVERNGVSVETTRQQAHLVVLYLRSRSLLYRLEHGLSLGEHIPPAH
jgi:hypothetical protein